MSVKIEASGRRSVQVEVEVPGTPEQVWQAIATGPGISSWFQISYIFNLVAGVLGWPVASGWFARRGHGPRPSLALLRE